MRNSRQAAELLFEQEQRIGAQVKQGLERDGDIAVAIMGFIHHPHAAFAQLATDDKAGISLEDRGHRRQTKLSLCGGGGSVFPSLAQGMGSLQIVGFRDLHRPLTVVLSFRQPSLAASAIIPGWSALAWPAGRR